TFFQATGAVTSLLTTMVKVAFTPTGIVAPSGVLSILGFGNWQLVSPVSVLESPSLSTTVTELRRPNGWFPLLSTQSPACAGPGIAPWVSVLTANAQLVPLGMSPK